MQTAMLVLVSLVTFADKPEGWVSPKVKKDAPKWAVNYFRESERERLKVYAQNLEIVSDEKGYIKKQTKLGKTPAQRKHYAEIAKEEVDGAKKKCEDIKRDVLYVPTRSMEPTIQPRRAPKVGDCGTMGLCHVRQVLGEAQAMMENYSGSSGRGDPYTFLLKGVSTEGWVDGSGQTLKMTLCVTGTQTLPLAGGGTRTVFVLEATVPERYLEEEPD